jgi:hypothetical protein
MVTAGKDYVFSPHLRTVLAGVGPTRACALVTRRAIYLLPDTGLVAPAAQVAPVLADPAITPERLDEVITARCAATSGAVIRALAAQRRIKIRAGFFTRSVRFSERPDGLWGSIFENVGWRLAKDEPAAYQAFFAGDPRLV